MDINKKGKFLCHSVEVFLSLGLTSIYLDWDRWWIQAACQPVASKVLDSVRFLGKCRYKGGRKEDTRVPGPSAGRGLPSVHHPVPAAALPRCGLRAALGTGRWDGWRAKAGATGRRVLIARPHACGCLVHREAWCSKAASDVLMSSALLTELDLTMISLNCKSLPETAAQQCLPAYRESSRQLWPNSLPMCENFWGVDMLVTPGSPAQGASACRRRVAGGLQRGAGDHLLHAVPGVCGRRAGRALARQAAAARACVATPGPPFCNPRVLL